MKYQFYFNDELYCTLEVSNEAKANCILIALQKEYDGQVMKFTMKAVETPKQLRMVRGKAI